MPYVHREGGKTATWRPHWQTCWRCEVCQRVTEYLADDAPPAAYEAIDNAARDGQTFCSMWCLRCGARVLHVEVQSTREGGWEPTLDPKPMTVKQAAEGLIRQAQHEVRRGEGSHTWRPSDELKQRTDEAKPRPTNCSDEGVICYERESGLPGFVSRSTIPPGPEEAARLARRRMPWWRRIFP